MASNQKMMGQAGQVYNWQNIIWREWRNCESSLYARHLFELVADEPVGWGAKLAVLLLSMLSGVFAGLLIGFIVTTEWMILRQFALTGGVIGGLRGFWIGQRLSWRAWLTRLEAIMPAEGLGGWLLGGLALGVAGGLIFGPIFWLLLVGLFWVMGGVIKWLNRGLTKATDEYQYRTWWIWWRGRPPTHELKTALQQVCQVQPAARAIWTMPLQRLAEKQEQSQPPETLRDALQSDDWVEHFVAHHTLSTLGQDAIKPQGAAR